MPIMTETERMGKQVYFCFHENLRNMDVSFLQSFLEVSCKTSSSMADRLEIIQMMITVMGIPHSFHKTGKQNSANPAALFP